jgi:hypothetical protein
MLRPDGAGAQSAEIELSLFNGENESPIAVRGERFHRR